MKKIFLFAGEASGDHYGQCLIRSLKDYGPCEIYGVGGPLMRPLLDETLLPMEEFQIIGFTAALTALPRLFKHHRFIKKAILEKNPDAVILIDFPDFNLFTARALKKSPFLGKVIQFISPTVWAWRKGRIKTMEKNLDKLLTIFPFEKDLFSNTSLDVEYIGHPLINIINSYSYDPLWKEENGLEEGKLVGLFPGSRTIEVELNLPNILATAYHLYQKDPSIQLAISVAREPLIPVIEKILKASPLTAKLIPAKHTYEVMKESHSALAVSGTATLELALHNTPSVVFYHLPKLNNFIGKKIFGIDLPYYCIVNILSGKEVFPEIIDTDFPLEKATKKAFLIHDKGPKRSLCLKECCSVKESLGYKNAIDTATKTVRKLIDG